MAQVHAVCCQKGGVGKTTITVNLAAVVDQVLATDEPAVLVVGTDPQRSMDWWAHRVGDKIPFAYTETDDPAQLEQLRDLDYEHVFVDTPGSLENEHILRSVLKSADDAIVPITTEPLTFVPADTTISEVIEPLGVPFTVAINLWDARDGHVDLDDTIAFIEKKGWPRANTVIRRYKIHSRAAAEGVVCTQYAKSRVALEAQQDILRLALELGYGRTR
ncbi:ParA family protein [Pseudonocardia parietis]|uniref:Chromosome partitioning protein n=1 Tax=Pseudonocardia parietis TaxID=570936 RepID=A0ABS4W557_9PSEU|nr:ParA family protein [Pseudonocardia parietis]MBP2371345.1 chromosome partitioning protein [Pseudonocardia parietis]